MGHFQEFKFKRYLIVHLSYLIYKVFKRIYKLSQVIKKKITCHRNFRKRLFRDVGKRFGEKVEASEGSETVNSFVVFHEFFSRGIWRPEFIGN